MLYIFLKSLANGKLDYQLNLYLDNQEILMKIHISIYRVLTKKLWLVAKHMK